MYTYCFLNVSVLNISFEDNMCFSNNSFVVAMQILFKLP